MQEMSVDRVLKRARTAMKSGDFDGARILLADLLRRHPGNVRAVSALEDLIEATRMSLAVPKAEAARLYRLGDYRAAAEHAQKLVKIDPDDVVVLELFGNALVRLKQWSNAVVVLRRLAELAPADLAARNLLAFALMQLSEDAAAAAIAESVLALDPDNVTAHFHRGAALRSMGRHDEAEAAFRAAARGAPDSVDVLLQLGICRAEMGDKEGSRAALHAVMEKDPDRPEAHRHHALVHKFSAGDPYLTKLEELVQRAPSDVIRAELSFALGKAYDDAKDYHRAFDAFAKANRVFGQMRGYRRDEDVADAARFLRAGQPGPTIAVPDGAQRPIFILGMPRSGTSLMEQILCRHPLVGALGEVDGLRYAVRRHWDRTTEMSVDALTRIAKDFREYAASRSSAPVVTDKMLVNVRLVGIIARAMPDAVIIDMRRTPEASCWSIFRSGLTGGVYSYGHDLSDLGFAYNLYRATMAAWDRAYPGRVHRVEYEQLVADPHRMIPEILTVCGLPFNEACLKPHEAARGVRTASALQVREPIYKGSSEAWQRYGDWLGPLREALAQPWPDLAEGPTHLSVLDRPHWNETVPERVSTPSSDQPASE